MDQVWRSLCDLNVEAQILTGDPKPHIPIPSSMTIHAGLSSEQKVKFIFESVKAEEEPIFVGDGINDAAAMSVSRASIAMSSGAGLTNSVAMGQLRSDRIEAIPEAIRLSRRVRARLRGNLVYAATYNVIGMSLAAAGLLHPVFAALLMLVSSFIVASRAIRFSSV